jgi:hypothetical protein
LFAFQKSDASGWRCTTSVLQPVELGVAMRAHDGLGYQIQDFLQFHPVNI